jgi:hypothetical protein
MQKLMGRVKVCFVTEFEDYYDEFKKYIQTYTKKDALLENQ